MDVGSADIIMQMNNGHFVVRSLHVAAELGVADHIDDLPVPMAALAARVGAKPELMGRILRLLASRGVFRVIGSAGEGRVSHTPPSRLLRSDHPHSLLPFIRNTSLVRNWRLPEHMLQMVRTGEPALADGSMWSTLETTPEEARVFDAAMAAKAHVQIAAVLEAIDFSEYGHVVDVGGGAGHLLRALLGRYQHMTGVLFDRPDVVEAASAAGNLGGRLRFCGGDFFAHVPCGDGTILMDVLHDWGDADCRRILAASRFAAPPHSRLLVLETEVEEGNGADWGKLQDVIMMTIFNGKQRSRSEFEALFAASGYRLARTVPTLGGPTLFVGEPV